MKNNIVAGFDIGYANVKAVFKDSSNKIYSQSFPRIISMEKGLDGAWDNLRTVDIYSIDDMQFLIGKDALLNLKQSVSFETREYMEHQSYWACMVKVFYDAGLLNPKNTSIYIDRLVLGLAPGHYNRELIKKMIAVPRTGINVSINGQAYSIRSANVQILPQGAGCFFSYLMADNGDYKKNRESVMDGMFGIVDIGYKTVDFIMFSEGQFIPDSEELSEDNGFKQLLGNLRESIFIKHKFKIDLERLNYQLINGGKIKINRKVEDLTIEIKRFATEYIKNNIESEILKRWEDSIPLMEKVIISGGGAHILQFSDNFLKKYSDICHIPTTPEMDNASGFFKFGVRTSESNLRRVA